MLRILDKLLLFAMCSCLIFQLEGDYRRVVIFIIGLIVAALTLYIENRKVIGALLIAMAVLCLIEPGFTFLLPVWCNKPIAPLPMTKRARWLSSMAGTPAVHKRIKLQIPCPTTD